MKKKHIYTSLLLLVILLALPWHHVLAASSECAEVATLNSAQGIFGMLLDIILRVGSRIWVIIADLAGKLMSNEWVYASGIGLDKTLWKLWNYMKNIANLAIAGLLIYQIAKGIIGKNTFDVKSLLPKVLISSILVNMSWFIMGAAIDLSNIGTAAVGAVPQMFFQQNSQDEANARKLLASTPKKITVQMECKNPVRPEEANNDYGLDKVRARFNDMSGPLVYIGLSIFRFQEYNFVNDKTTSRKDLSVAAAIKIIILIMFLAPIIALFIVNLQRVFYLWLVIIFSPLLIVFNEKLGMAKMPQIDGKIGKNSIGDLLSIKEVVGMIFAPVFTIGAMALALILSSSMYFVLGGTPGHVDATNTKVSTVLGGGTTITKDAIETTSFTTPGADITLQGDIFGNVAKYAGGLVGYLIMVSFTIFLLRGVLGVSVSSSKLAKGTYDGIMNLGKNLASGFQFIPIGGGKSSIGSLMKAPENIMNKYSGSMNEKIGKESRQISNAFWRTNAVGKFGAKALGLDIDTLKDIEEYESKNIKNEIAGTDNFKDVLGKIKSKLDKEGKVAINVDTATNLKKLLTSYAKEKPTAISTFSTGYAGLDNAWKKELMGFTEDKADALFDTTKPLGQAFISILAKELGGIETQPANVNGSTLLYKTKPTTQNRSGDDDEGATETPPTEK